MAEDDKAAPAVEHRFGKCCEELREAIAGDDFDPLIAVGPEGILYMAVGLIELDDEEPGMVDHPLFFCPFCGASLQDKETVKAQLESLGEVQQ